MLLDCVSRQFDNSTELDQVSQMSNSRDQMK